MIKKTDRDKDRHSFFLERMSLTVSLNWGKMLEVITG